MNVLTIRSHMRFAVRHSVEVAGTAGKNRGLLIELSVDGCRISGLGQATYTAGDQASVRLGSEHVLHGQVRWVREGTMGIWFDRRLARTELDELLVLGRSTAELRAYGT